ncbi:ThuA domain-containing protein [Cellulomonas bogoriensis]|uniref:Glycosyl hydrolase n=1 Tax=Cellulomonas bogoriensis 69B4 = DSM 16987 TaxID=1386082 RepID=A0A0A0C0S3_9CELL|nr:ThuA domain-containing protein [Cellulomonas bogoriensis]KGM13029.1 glycosyl hydrolase [Cellulomonas bogoriensis 69B4 = DSM 16987]
MNRALLFSRTTDYRHESIGHAVASLTQILGDLGVPTDHTENPAVFTPDGLSRYTLMVWVSTSGNVLDGPQREAFAQWLADGASWAGVHSASFTEPGWPEFESICGAVFTDHPDIQTATVHVTDGAHPSTADLPEQWEHEDEWYNFRSRPLPDRTVLLTVDEGTYDGGSMGQDHPVAWYGPYGRGRTWYTSLGHSAHTYDHPVMRAHLSGAMRSLLH